MTSRLRHGQASSACHPTASGPRAARTGRCTNLPRPAPTWALPPVAGVPTTTDTTAGRTWPRPVSAEDLGLRLFELVVGDGTLRLELGQLGQLVRRARPAGARRLTDVALEGLLLRLR